MLPGGDFSGWTVPSRNPTGDFERFAVEVGRRYRWMPERHLRRMAHAYGSRVDQVLAPSAAGMGDEVAPGLFEAELDYLQREEWATTADDVLWRRSKLGLHFTPRERQDVAVWMECKNNNVKKVA